MRENVREVLELISEARVHWTFTEDPGPGAYPFGKRFQLRIDDLEIKKNEMKRRYLVELLDEPGHPLTMSFGWDGFYENLSQPIKAPPQEEFDMTKMSINDEELREKVRLKCKNDWDLELTEDQISMCIIEMEQQKLSIFHNQIWPNKRRWTKKEEDARGRVNWVKKERITWDKAIDGYRAVAQRTGRFAGIDAATFETTDDGQLLARMTVYAMDAEGYRRAYVGEARFNEFVQLVDEWEDRKKTGKKIPGGQWAEKPHNQLSIAAERQALRKAFQELDEDDDQAAAQHPEPDLERSRGARAPLPPEETPEPSYEPPPSPPLPGPAPEPQRTKAPKKKTKPQADSSKSKPKGKYVGIPKDGFSQSQMYNKEERIVMYGQKGSVHHLALDSGEKVVVSGDGHETDRAARSDKFKGGRKWKVGDEYYDGSYVEKIANSKNNEWNLWLALNNGFKVCVDRWGKEKKRKEQKGAKEHPASAPPASPSPPQPVPAPQPAEAPTTGKGGPVDPEAVTTVEMMRKITTPLLKRWCLDIAGKRMNPKQAYGHLTGVVLNKGQSISLDDYKVLYQCLEEAIEDAAANR